jgi:hypothetical protein
MRPRRAGSRGGNGGGSCLIRWSSGSDDRDALMPDASYAEVLRRLAGLLANIPLALEWHVPTEKVVTGLRRVRPGPVAGRYRALPGPVAAETGRQGPRRVGQAPDSASNRINDLGSTT